MIIRVSSLPGWPDCQLRTAVRLWPNVFIEAGYTPRETLQTIGAAVGTAVHKGAAAILNEKMSAGETPTFVSEFDDIVVHELRAKTIDDTRYDAVSPNKPTAEQQAIRMIKTWYFDEATEIQPIVVEEPLEAHIGEHVIRGHADLLARVPDGIQDLKTGVRRRSPIAQGGGYLGLNAAHGRKAKTFSEAFLRRVRLNQDQPPVIKQYFDATYAARLARTIIDEMIYAYEAFARWQDPAAFTPNPWSMLCKREYCGAFGTDICLAHTKEI